jgi:hypothetical protein
MRQQSTFRQSDLTRAVKALRAAGLGIKRAEITKDKIVLVPDKSNETKDKIVLAPDKSNEDTSNNGDEPNEWDAACGTA